MPEPGRGSSPLTRGKRSAFGRDNPELGLIPAHAGKTRSPAPKTSTQTAHPRSRGENIEAFVSVPVAEGSSPLTRGKLDHAHDAGNRGRLIPAHAGKTLQPNRHFVPVAAHPRSRGENLEDGQAGLAHAGSSPLTRGKPVSPGSTRSTTGLIPAHAGKTLTTGRY